MKFHRIFAWSGLLLLLLLPSAGHGEPDPKSLFDGGVAKYKAGSYQDAVDIFTQLIALEPNNAKGYKNRGVALMSLMKMDEAIADFNMALSIAPDLNGLYSNLGAAWHYKGEYEKAVESYNAAIKEDPNSYISYFNRGVSHVALNQYEEAVADFTKTLSLHPGFEPAETAKNEVQQNLIKPEKGGFTLQMGAFLIRENALQMEQDFKAKGINTSVVSLPDKKNRTWYLVRYNAQLTRNKAEQLKSEMKDRHHIDSVVRPENSF